MNNEHLLILDEEEMKGMDFCGCCEMICESGQVIGYNCKTCRGD